MALTSFFVPHITPTKSVRSGFMLKHSQIPMKKAPVLVVRCSSENKVFENESEGIICYRDEDGEITCEGYDEGPRFDQQQPRTAHDTRCRDAEIIYLLQQRLLQIVNGSETSLVGIQEDFN